MEIGCQEISKGMSQADLAFAIEACNIQMRDHFAPKWGLEPWPLVPYSSLTGLIAGTFWPMSIRDQLDTSGALGYHDYILGMIYAEVLYQGPDTGITCSHEALELRLDPMCNEFIDMGAGYKIAKEACDPCENDIYYITVSLMGVTRAVAVSDFVLPSYFDPKGVRPFTYLDTIDQPFRVSRNGGGYRILMLPNGDVVHDFGDIDLNSTEAIAKTKDLKDKKWPRLFSRTRRRGVRF